MKVIILLLVIGLLIWLCKCMRPGLFWLIYRVDIKEHVSEYYKRKKVQFALFKYRSKFLKYDKPGYTLAISVILFDLITLIIYVVNFSKWDSSIKFFFDEVRVNYGILDFITLLFLFISFGGIIYIFVSSNDSERDFKHEHNDLIDWKLPDYADSDPKFVMMGRSSKQARLLQDYIGKSHYTRFAMAKIIAMNSEELRGRANSNILCIANEEVISGDAIYVDMYKATLFDYLLSNVVNDKKICDNFSEEITYEISITEHTYIHNLGDQRKINKLPNNSLDSANPLILRRNLNGKKALYLIKYDNELIDNCEGKIDLQQYLSKLLKSSVVISKVGRLEQQKELIVVDINLNVATNCDSLIEISKLLGVKDEA